MTWLKHGAVLGFALAVSASVEPLEAQRRGARGRAPGASVEQALRLRDTLQLTDDQVAQLQALRQEAVADRQAAMEHFIDVRSRFRAGDMTSDELQEELASRREDARSRADGREERFSGTLTEGQLDQLATAHRRTFRMGRRGGWPGGGRGFRDWGPAGPGQGYGPGRGWRGSRRWMGPGAGRGFRRGPFRGRRPWR
jgi:hypothetical protein